jgi:UDP-glucose:(heptosyl)LPS alpha-1,3-glucosyltransferase
MRRIAIVRQRYNAAGGAERFVQALLSGLASNSEYAFHLLAREWKSGAQSAQPTQSTSTSTLQFESIDPFYLGSAWRDRSFARAVQQHLLAHPYDLVQSHERVAGVDVFRAGDGVHARFIDERLRLPSEAGWKIKLNPHHQFILREEARMFTHPALKAVVCNSQLVANDVRARFGLAQSKLHVIYNAVDQSRFSGALRGKHRVPLREQLKLPIFPSEAFVFLMVGSGFERKGVARAINALAQLPKHAHLVVVGADKHQRRYVSQAAGLHLGSRVHFVGVQNPAAPWYGMADAFVLPALYDPCPNAGFEAMASELPIITSTQCGIAELLGERHDQPAAGFACDYLDEATLATLMARLMSMSAVDLRAMGQAARAAVTPFTEAAMVAQYVALYETLTKHY